MAVLKLVSGTGMALLLAIASLSAEAAPACEQTATWVAPASGDTPELQEVLRRLDDKQVVLLGETHTRADHHQWQLHMLAALQARRGAVAVGFESFPRAAQPVLDRWVADELSVPEFLQQTDWRRVWNFDADLYLPLFEFARMYRLPMLAMNVESALVRRIGREGWEAIPESERAGLGDPAPIGEAYEDFLWSVFQSHPARDGAGSRDAADRGDPAFRRFVQVQQTWDRAMAEAIAGALQTAPERPVVGILGMGHVQERWGVPHQLAAMGIDKVAVLLPWTSGQECETLTASVADAVFMMRAPPEGAAGPPPPRLGILIVDSKDPSGVRVSGVSASSVAEAAGLKKDDVIVNAAGTAVTQVRALIAIVQRQAPGTWLPLAVQRGDERIDLVAKFPSAP